MYVMIFLRCLYCKK